MSVIHRKVITLLSSWQSYPNVSVSKNFFGFILCKFPFVNVIVPKYKFNNPKFHIDAFIECFHWVWIDGWVSLIFCFVLSRIKQFHYKFFHNKSHKSFHRKMKKSSLSGVQHHILLFTTCVCYTLSEEFQNLKFLIYRLLCLHYKFFFVSSQVSIIYSLYVYRIRAGAVRIVIASI